MRDANILQVTTMQLCAGLGAPVGAVVLRIGGPLDVSADQGFSIAFLILAAVCLLATVAALRLDRAAGDGHRSRHRPAG